METALLRNWDANYTLAAILSVELFIALAILMICVTIDGMRK